MANKMLIPWNTPTHKHQSPNFTWRLSPHKGKHIHSVPSDYLEWCLHTVGGVALAQARRELRRRHSETVKLTRHKQRRRREHHRHHTHRCEATECHKGPHRYQLRCVECDSHIQWLSKAQYEVIVNK